jgi:hypothetical protein
MYEGGVGSTHWRDKKIHKILVVKPEGKRLLARLSRTWENNIKTDRENIGLEYVDWNHLAQRPMVGFCEHSNESPGSIKCG